MTDNEIIKGLECCGRESCNGCPYNKNCHQGNPMIGDALDLIKRQQEEIERLKEFIVETRRCDKEIKSEAIKEFWGKLKKHSRKMQSSDFSGEFWDRAVLVEDGDNLLKEMVREYD